MSAIGADLAARKGMLVAVAAGNEGNNSWGRIITPSDADSVLAVGAITYNGVAATFTSRGPSADGQTKPDVASVGVQTILQYPGGAITGGNGTSFATPNMAGLATCLWQGFPEFNNMKIIDALRRAGSRFTNPNDSIGYGIPDVRKALMQLTTDYSTANATLANACKTSISWSSKDVAAMRYEIERNVPGQSGFSTVATVNGQGSVFSNHNYQLTDSLVNVPTGTVTYRIRQVFDAESTSFAAEYIDQVTVNAGAGCTATGIDTPTLPEGSIVLLPNPTRNAFGIKISIGTTIQDLQLQITDAAGKVVYRQKRSLPAGTSVIPVNLGIYASGKYFVTLYGNGQLLGTRELIKL
jgi:serine protease AprX